MRFFINPDVSAGIAGWLCPDDYRAAVRVKVVLDGRTTTMLDCTIPYGALQEWGWHQTGLCGFLVDETSVPGVDAAQRLEIFDPDSNVLLYRRLSPHTHIARRLFLINAGTQPESALQAGLFPFFQTSYFDVGNLPDENLRILMTNAKWVDSVLLSGSIMVSLYADLFAPSAIEAAILVRDPYESLAVRLSALARRAAMLEDAAQEWRIGGERDAIAFAAAFDPLDRRGGRRLLREMPEAAYRTLAHPLTRLLATGKPGDPVGAGSAAAAIEMLARIDIVGHATHYGAFVETICHHLGIPPFPEPEPVPAAILAAAQALREGGDAEFLVSQDLALSEAVARIVAKQWAG